MPEAPGAQWVLDAATVEPVIPLVRAEMVTIEDDEEEDPGEFSDAMAERGIRSLTLDVDMAD